MLNLFYICKTQVAKTYQKCLKNTGPLKLKNLCFHMHSDVLEIRVPFASATWELKDLCTTPKNEEGKFPK